MSKTIEHNGFLLVEVPDRLVTYQIFGNYITWYTDSATNSTVTTEQLPPGNYQIIGLAKDLEWGNKKDLLEYEWDGQHYWYRNYLQNGEMLKDINKAFESLLKYRSLEPSTTLILKKQQ